jgi:hypothetical protein
MLGALPSSSKDSVEKRTEFGTGVETGFSLAQYHDTCIDFRVFFVSAEFFTGLHKVETSGGPEFRKGTKTYRIFPDRLTVDLQATAYKCAGILECPPSPDLASGLLNELSFDVNWKKGSEIRPVTIASTQRRHRPLAVRWDYFLEISAKDIPLTEQLVIDVTARDHVSLCRLTSSLK